MNERINLFLSFNLYNQSVRIERYTDDCVTYCNHIPCIECRISFKCDTSLRFLNKDDLKYIELYYPEYLL